MITENTTYTLENFFSDCRRENIYTIELLDDIDATRGQTILNRYNNRMSFYNEIYSYIQGELDEVDVDRVMSKTEQEGLHARGGSQIYDDFYIYKNDYEEFISIKKDNEDKAYEFLKEHYHLSTESWYMTLFDIYDTDIYYEQGTIIKVVFAECAKGAECACFDVLKVVNKNNYIPDFSNTFNHSIYNGDKRIKVLKIEDPYKICENSIKDFIYKIDNSSKLEIESTYDSIDDFFNEDSDDLDDYLTILTVGTKIPLIRLEKTDSKNCYKFIVDINTKNNDTYIVKTTFKTKEKFNQLLNSTIASLKEYPQFSNYADDLESCL